MRATGRTITEAQIQELLDWAGRQGKRRIERSCRVAIEGATIEDLRRRETQQVARERCALAYNTMVGGRQFEGPKVRR